MITPLCEVTVESLTKSITYHVSSTILMLTCDFILFVSVEGLSFSDGNIHFILNCTTSQLILRTLPVMLERIKDIMQQILLIMLSKCNSCHIRLQQMPVVKDLILPAFQIFVQHSMSLSLLISEDPPHLLEDLR